VRFVVVTGTDTGVGKTVTTAALVCAARARGLSVSVVKPYQTGITGDEPSDAGTVQHLSGCENVHELVRLDDPLAPESAARLRGLPLRTVPDVIDDVVACATGRDVTFVEGAGGVAVRLDLEGGTIATLAAGLRDGGHQVDVVVVTSVGLGTLNHTELTVGALRMHRLEPAGLVLGAVPRHLGLAETCNLEDLPRLAGVPVVGSIPDGAGALSPEQFQRSAPTWLSGGQR
jgi:dethiobiotin synthase